MTSVEAKRDLDLAQEDQAGDGPSIIGLSEGSALRPSTMTNPSPLRMLEEVHQLRSKLEEAYAMIDELRMTRSDLEESMNRLRRAASTDDLTGLWNRRFFIESLDVSYSFAVRHRLPLSIVVLDVDHFKAFNDDFGHAAGDGVLRDVATLIQGCVRDHDVAARYGGEEFVILLPGTGRNGALAMADRVRGLLEAREIFRRPITASLGTATLRHLESDEVFTAANLFEAADLAMYHSKRQGRNRVTHADQLISSDLLGNRSHGSTASRHVETLKGQIADLGFLNSPV